MKFNEKSDEDSKPDCIMQDARAASTVQRVRMRLAIGTNRRARGGPGRAAADVADGSGLEEGFELWREIGREPEARLLERSCVVADGSCRSPKGNAHTS